MSLPTYDQLIFPLLKELGQRTEPLLAREARDALALELGLAEAALAELLPSGQRVFDNRVGWAHDRLKRAGLSTSARRGQWQLTSAGREFLRANVKGLSEAMLRGLVGVSADSRASGLREDAPATAALVVTPSGGSEAAPSVSPQERMERAFAELQDQLAADLLTQVREVHPTFFEKLVLDLLHAMGYGVSRRDLKQVGQAGDGGIDGIVDLDKLGLQKVYVQAKRWQDGNTVGRPEIQAFYGALAERRATYGVFITASAFSVPAIRAAESLSDTIVLIDGNRLVRLMIEHNVGVSSVLTLTAKRIDSDYFADE